MSKHEQEFIANDEVWECILQLEPEDRIIWICILADQVFKSHKLNLTDIGETIHVANSVAEPTPKPFDRNQFQRQLTRAALNLSKVLVERPSLDDWKRGRGDGEKPLEITLKKLFSRLVALDEPPSDEPADSAD